MRGLRGGMTAGVLEDATLHRRESAPWEQTACPGHNRGGEHAHEPQLFDHEL